MVYHKHVYTLNNHSERTRPQKYDYQVLSTMCPSLIYNLWKTCFLLWTKLSSFLLQRLFSLSLILVTQVQRNQFCVGTTYSRSLLWKTYRYLENHNALPLTHSTYITARVRQPPVVIRYQFVWLTIWRLSGSFLMPR